MSTPDRVAIVSPRLLQVILDAPTLKRQLLPEGLTPSPYKVLDYDNTLVLGGKTGAHAVVARVQHIELQQDGVVAILDHFWGDGRVTNYRTSAGAVRGLLLDGPRQHLLIRLNRPLQRGERLRFTVERRLEQAFPAEEEWEETTIDHPILQLHRTILFPKQRPCQHAWLVVRGEQRPLQVLIRRDGRTELRVRIPQPEANTPYLIRWRW